MAGWGWTLELMTAAVLAWLPVSDARAAEVQRLIDLVPKSDEDAGTVSVESHQDWSVTCPSDAGTTCRMQTEGELDLGAAGRVRILLTGEHSRAGQGVVMYFRTPLDLLLAKGVRLQVDNRAPVQLAYRSCHVTGCLVPFKLAGGIGTSFRRGRQLTATFYSLDAKPLPVTLSLRGLTASLKALRQ